MTFETPSDGPQPNDADIVVGYPRMSEVSREEGLFRSASTISKRGAPSVNTGPELIGYFGQRPATTRGLLRKWLRSQLRPDRPVITGRHRNDATTSVSAEATSPA